MCRSVKIQAESATAIKSNPIAMLFRKLCPQISSPKSAAKSTAQTAAKSKKNHLLYRNLLMMQS